MSTKIIQTLVLSASLVVGSLGAVSTSYAKGSDVLKGVVILGAAAAVGYGIAKSNERHDQRHYVQARDNKKVVVVREKAPAYRYDRRVEFRKPTPHRHDRNEYARNNYDRYDRDHYDHRYHR